MVAKRTRKNYKRSVSVSHDHFPQSAKKDLVKTFLEMLNLIKLYHWHTYSYPEHKATDELYSSLNGHIDRFVEVLLGKEGGRINQVERVSYVIPDPQSTGELKKKVEEFKDFLYKFPLSDPKDSDLANIRDEIVADLNQFLYLLTFH